MKRQPKRSGSFSPNYRRGSAPLAAIASAALFALVLTGCGKPKQAHVQVPPPPAIPAPEAHTAQGSPAGSASQPGKTGATAEEITEPILVPPGTKPVSVETGLASWYGAPYHNRRGSNGQIYDMNAMTAAHRTLPLGSIVRVTNLKTSHSALVRITDRGPFIPGRILDLSLAAAKEVDVWKAGIAMVRVEVLETPAPLDTGGRWAVQIGAFNDETAADQLADRLTRRFHTAKVLRFSSPTGDWWVRIRVLDDDRKRAQDVVHDTSTPQGAIFLVRLD